MSAKEIHTAIRELTPAERSELVSLLIEQHHDDWDKQIESDLESGRLDKWLSEMCNEQDAEQIKPL